MTSPVTNHGRNPNPTWRIRIGASEHHPARPRLVQAGARPTDPLRSPIQPGPNHEKLLRLDGAALSTRQLTDQFDRRRQERPVTRASKLPGWQRCELDQVARIRDASTVPSPLTRESHEPL